MSRSTKFKSVFKKLGFILTVLPSVLLILGTSLIFSLDNLFSFIYSVTLPILLVLNIAIGCYWLIKKNKLFLLSLFSVLLYFLCFDSFLQFNLPKLTDTDNTYLKNNTLSLLSFNTHGFNYLDHSNGEDKQIINFIKNKNPDVFCIQEFSAIKYKYFNDYPYFYKTNIFTQNKSVMAIFSKYPIRDKGYINFPNSSNGAMYVDIDVNEVVIRIYNLHLESYKMNAIHQLNNPKSYSPIINRISEAEKLRKEQAVLVKAHIDEFDGKVILSGDFNSTQFSSTYRLLKGARKDSFIEAGKGFGSTYKLYKYPFRLDYILVDDKFQVLSHQNFDIKLSDHEPIFTRLLVN